MQVYHDKKLFPGMSFFPVPDASNHDVTNFCQASSADNRARRYFGTASFRQ